jgi:hypothetical protein
MRIQERIEVVVRDDRHDRLAQGFSFPPPAFVLDRLCAVFHGRMQLQAAFDAGMKPTIREKLC